MDRPSESPVDDGRRYTASVVGASQEVDKDRATAENGVRFAHSQESWDRFHDTLIRLISQSGARHVLEVGGGANPAVTIDEVHALDLEYTVLDISPEELAKAPEGYVKLLADIRVPDLDLGGEYDLVFSKMLAEHVRSGSVFHRNVHRLLRKGGLAFHFFPTLYAPPFVVNRLLPERLAERILHFVQQGRERHGSHAKFPAYYSWCRGPTNRQISRFEKLGFRIVEYVGFFGHGGYYKKLWPLMTLDRQFTRWLIRHPIPMLTSFAYVVLSKDR